MRRSDWEQRLAAYIESKMAKPHVYGRHDCMTFAAGVARAITGKDLARGHRRKYHSAKSAAAYLKKVGFSSSRDMIASHLSRRPKALAQRGDIVIADGEPGVCIGADALFVGENGLVRRPRSEWAKTAYTVGG